MWALARDGTMAEPERFLRLPEVCALTGCSRSTLYELMQRGAFPAAVKIGPKSVAWPSSEIAAWQQECIAARDRAA
jgi:prophage regulatory protein